MKNLYKQKRTEGFTIIEVLIVLAIAALILLIVFLAVPALQRSSRNHGRTNDAALIAAAVNSCLANNNGLIANCSANGQNNVSVALTQFSQFTVLPTYGAGGQGTINNANVSWGYSCNGGAPQNGAPGRAFAVTWQDESGSATPTNRCLSS